MTTLAEVIEQQQEVIVERWLERIRLLAPAPNLTRAELVDSMPKFLRAIALALRRLQDPRIVASLPHSSPISQEHGEQRDRLHFSVSAVAREYPLLHEEILVAASEQGVSVSAEETVLLARCMGTGSAEALAHFTSATETGLLNEAAEALAERHRARIAEQRAKESEARLRVLVDSLPFLIAFVDTDERYILHNRAYLSWFGLESVIGRRVQDVLGDETYANVAPYIRRALGGEPVQYESAFVFPTKGTGFVHGTYVPYRDEAGQVRGLVALIEDVTERRALHEQLEAYAERLRQTLAVTGAGTFDFDLVTGNGQFDERMREITRWPEDKTVSLETATAQVHPEDRPRMQEAFAAAISGTTPYIVEHRIVAKPGERERWLSARGGVILDSARKPVRFVGTSVDITEQRRAREELALIFEYSADMMGMATPDGHFRRVNPAFVRTLGWTSEELVTTPFMDLVFPEDVERTRSQFAALVAGSSATHFENRYRRKDGVYRWLSWAAAPLPDRSLVYCTARDVTGEKDRADFEQHLIGIVSHDLRNPLQAILLAARGLLRADPTDERAVRAAGRIQTAADRAVRLVSDLLDFTQARLGGGIRVVRRPMDLHARVRATVEEVEAVHPDRTIELTCEGDTRGSWDGDRIAQITENLLTNALKYSATNTPVWIASRSEDGHVVLEVHNVGAPIAPEVLPRIFEPMQRASAEVDKQSRSVGLGLHIVRHLVEAHGGTIQVRSSAEQGTTFRVRLPKDDVPLT